MVGRRQVQVTGVVASILRRLRELRFAGQVVVVARQESDGGTLKVVGTPTLLYPIRNAIDFEVEALTAVIRNNRAGS